MPCSACERRRKKLIEERNRRKRAGEKVIPAMIDGAIAVIDKAARPTKQRATPEL